MRKKQPVERKKEGDSFSDRSLVLINDDHNSFEHVIKCLVEICGHDPVQAEQCAVITHFKGSCEIKTGNMVILDSMCSGLVGRGLTAEIK